MATDTASRSIGYAQREPTKAPAWHALVAWDMLFNNLSSGLFLVAAVSELVLPDVFVPVARLAYPVALVFLLVDLVLLTLDLGDLGRFHHMLRMFKPGSPMSLGVWSLTVYSVPLTVAALLSILPGESVLEVIRKVAVVLGLVPALASAVYKGVLLSTSAQPGWKDARWLGGYLTSAAVVLGGAQMIVLAHVMGHLHAVEVLQPALAVLLVVHAVPSFLLFAELRPAMDRVFARRQVRRVTGSVVAGSFLVPLVLVIAGGGPVPLLGAVFLIVLGNLVTRLALVQLPHPSPA